MLPRTRLRRERRLIVGLGLLCSLLPISRGADETIEQTLDLETLLDVPVTSVGRKSESWFTAPAAIEALTSEDIRRYGATTLPDTLRIVPGLHVARYVGNSYAITARGFSSAAANKMQVLMDGRSLYTPLFSGVFWETQDTLLMDLDRIEVIRGPGATMWGANAVNGVINFTTKEARDTQGTLIEAGGGNEEIGFGAVRYGGRVNENSYYRVYTKYRYRDDQELSTGESAQDFSSHWQTGFRSDTYLSDAHQFTVQGDFYLNDFGVYARDNADTKGGNILGRWTRTFSEDSNLQIQAYFDRADRDVPLQYSEERSTGDLDIQHRFHIGERNDFEWGGTYRVSADDTGADGTYTFEPSSRTTQLFSGFAQDEITVLPERVFLTLGTKAEHNDFTGFEIQPSARVAARVTEDHVLWGAVSRAVRSPTRIEDDVRFHPTPGGALVTLAGNRDFESEDLLAYEVGYRMRLSRAFSLNLATFFNVYDNLRTLEPTPTGLPLTLKNEREGTTYGVEPTVRYQPAEWWRLTASYTFLEERLHLTDGSLDPTGGSTEGNDPHHMARVRSSLTLPYKIEFDETVRYVDTLPNPRIPSYVELDLRVAYRPIPGLELSVVGMNLLDSAHPEFNGGSAVQPEVQRSVYFRAIWLF